MANKITINCMPGNILQKGLTYTDKLAPLKNSLSYNHKYMK